MNVLDYSIRLGKLLRKTEEGRELFQLEMGIEEKYKDNEAFGQYEQFAEKKTSQFYFYSWNMAYKTFVNVLTDDSIEHRDFFLPMPLCLHNACPCLLPDNPVHGLPSGT